ncbi:MAG TPA: EscU/YscU/HrcU family type III secretion system export apparatus switch protein [Patescibacteria group bacterium]|nr:EscU/YscU/HrcU family type III secretion system export apparatus switch protein [Patescibacteria group bacterium]
MAKDDESTRPAKAKRSIAVALSYDPQSDNDAPKVVASGRGRVAEEILRLAFEKGVKVREDADLAQVLAAVEVDCIIPLEAFMAVAEILAFVYRANNREVPVPPPTPRGHA